VVATTVKEDHHEQGRHRHVHVRGRTYEIANGWGGNHPVNSAPTFVLTHQPPADHLAPYLFGGGVRLFDTLPDGIRLEKLSASDGPFATHLRYRVLRR
jgi:hypothetical protein